MNSRNNPVNQEVGKSILDFILDFEELDDTTLETISTAASIVLLERQTRNNPESQL